MLHERVDDEVLAGLLSLRNAPRSEAVRRWLSDCLAARDRANRRERGDALLVGQGEAQTLERLIELIDTAPQVLRDRRGDAA